MSLYGGFLNGVTALLFGTSSASPTPRCWRSPRSRSCALAVIAAVTGRCCSRRSIPTSRARAGCPCAALSRRRSSWCSAGAWRRRPDHRRAARVRAAGRARRGGAGAHAAARGEPRADRRRLGLAVAWIGLAHRVLLAVPRGFWISAIALRDLPARAASARLVRGGRVPARRSQHVVIEPPAAGRDRLMLSHPFMRNALLAGTRSRSRAASSATSWCCAARCSRRRAQPRRVRRRARRGGRGVDVRVGSVRRDGARRPSRSVCSAAAC